MRRHPSSRPDFLQQNHFRTGGKKGRTWKRTEFPTKFEYYNARKGIQHIRGNRSGKFRLKRK